MSRRLFPIDALPIPFAEVLKTAVTGYTLKFVIAIVSTPVIYAGRWVIDEWFGLKPLEPE